MLVLCWRPPPFHGNSRQEAKPAQRGGRPPPWRHTPLSSSRYVTFVDETSDAGSLPFLSLSHDAVPTPLASLSRAHTWPSSSRNCSPTVQPVTSWAARMAASKSRKPFGKRQTLSGSIVTRSRAQKLCTKKLKKLISGISRKKFFIENISLYKRRRERLIFEWQKSSRIFPNISKFSKMLGYYFIYEKFL